MFLVLSTSTRMLHTCITRVVAAPQLPQEGGRARPRGGSGGELDSAPSTPELEGAHALPPALLSWKLLLLVLLD